MNIDCKTDKVLKTGQFITHAKCNWEYMVVLRIIYYY